MKFIKAIGAMCIAASLNIANVPLSYAIGPAGMARGSLHYEASERIREGRFTLAPFSYVRFCIANPDDCRPAEPETLAWNYENLIVLAGVNWYVNKTMRPVYDNKGDDTWSAGGGAGDCEDFALTKRRKLIRQGIPASALRIAVAMTPSGEGHAVLLVRTSAGDFVLDNRTNRMLKWNQTDLSWVKIASAENPMIWRAAF